MSQVVTENGTSFATSHISPSRGLRTRSERTHMTDANARSQRVHVPGPDDNDPKELSTPSSQMSDANGSPAPQSPVDSPDSSPDPDNSHAIGSETNVSNGTSVVRGTPGRRGRRAKRLVSTGRSDDSNVPSDVSLVRISSRKKIKKSLGPDFLDPNQLNSQSKQRSTESTRLMSDSDKSRREEVTTVRCCYCDQKVESEMEERYASHKGSNLKYICHECRTDRSTSCCFCGEKEAEIICSMCETTSAQSFHYKCITAKSGHELDQLICRSCEQRAEPIKCVEKEAPAEKQNHNPSPKSNNTAPLVEDEAIFSKTSVSQPANHGSEIRVQSTPPPESDTKNTESLQNRMPETWTVEDVANFIHSAGFESAAETFKEQEIDGKSLLLMKRQDVISGLPGLRVGPALKIFSFINHLQVYNIVSKDAPGT